MNIKRVRAIGRDSYIRFCPNPGIGISCGTHRLAISWYGGIELFKADPKLVWRRTHSWLSRIKRPGGN